MPCRADSSRRNQMQAELDEGGEKFSRKSVRVFRVVRGQSADERARHRVVGPFALRTDTDRAAVTSRRESFQARASFRRLTLRSATGFSRREKRHLGDSPPLSPLVAADVSPLILIFKAGGKLEPTHVGLLRCSDGVPFNLLPRGDGVERACERGKGDDDVGGGLGSNLR